MLMFMFQDQPVTTDTGGAAAAGLGIGFTVLWLAIAVLMVASMWKVFEKAGKPGWAALVPIYNFVVLLEIAGKPVWWIVLFFIPVVNFIVIILFSISLAKKFGKGVGYGLGLAFLGVVFYPMLGFGDARYDPNAPA
jgi:uncharacterized membrane protein YhaH (DUF805 family)